MSVHTQIDTSKDSLFKGLNITNAQKNTFADFDETSTQNIWDNYSNQVGMMNQGFGKAMKQLNTGNTFSGSGAMRNAQATMRNTAQDKMKNMFNKAAFGEYTAEKDWLDKQQAQLADLMLSGDVTKKAPRGSNPGGGWLNWEDYDEWMNETGGDVSVREQYGWNSDDDYDQSVDGG